MLIGVCFLYQCKCSISWCKINIQWGSTEIFFLSTEKMSHSRTVSPNIRIVSRYTIQNLFMHRHRLKRNIWSAACSSSSFRREHLWHFPEQESKHDNIRVHSFSYWNKTRTSSNDPLATFRIPGESSPNRIHYFLRSRMLSCSYQL